MGIFSMPKKFVKHVRTETEVVSAEFKVNTIIKFDQCVISYYETNTLSDGSAMLIHKERIEPEKIYGFQLKIKIYGDEYEKNKRNIEAYVIDKIRQEYEYKKYLKECIEKEDTDREYIVDTFVAKECNNPDIHYEVNKIEEYIAQY